MRRESHNLEDVSEKGTQERRRLPRISLTSEQFRLASNGKIFPVTDLSSEGMAFRVLDERDMNLFPVATNLKGTLNLRGEKCEVSAQVRNVSRERVGCRFVSPSSALSEALSRLLDPKVLGEELKHLPSSEPDTTWYHGPSGTDLLLKRTSDGVYHRLMLYMLGSFVQWDAKEGLSTGTAEPSPEHGEAFGVVRFETILLKPDAVPDQGKLAIAKTLLLSSNLSQNLKNWCIRTFENT